MISKERKIRKAIQMVKNIGAQLRHVTLTLDFETGKDVVITYQTKTGYWTMALFAFTHPIAKLEGKDLRTMTKAFIEAATHSAWAKMP